jgi:hypothetical protein
VHELAEAFAEPVGECLYHDGVVVVVIFLEAKCRLVGT